MSKQEQESGENNSDRRAYTLPIQRQIVVGTWTKSLGEPCLFFWGIQNSPCDEPFLIISADPGQEITKIAKTGVTTSLKFEGVTDHVAEQAIKDVRRYGNIADNFLEERADRLESIRRKAILVFVKVAPSVEHELTKTGIHLLPARDLHPYSKWNNSLERRVEKAFKKFVVEK